MGVRPLRFCRTWGMDSGIPRTSVPVRGLYQYWTSCGRFTVFRDGPDRWSITSMYHTWAGWLSERGLSTGFPTRRELIAALEQCLSEEGLLDAREPAE